MLIGLFVVIAVLGQLISNTATALIVIPVAIAAATELDVSVRPVLMFVTVISSAALLTPVATPANLMVMGPGGYRFGDYAKLGLPCSPGTSWLASGSCRCSGASDMTSRCRTDEPREGDE